MKITIYQNPQQIDMEVAKQIVELVKQKPSCVLTLATGNTPLGVYKQLICDHKANQTDYKNVTTFNLDEYVGLAGDNVNSYRYYMDYNLFNHINIDKNNTHIPNGESKKLKQECDKYNKLLGENKTDLLLLGIGTNGHIGFNEPQNKFEFLTHVVKLSQSTAISNSVLFENGAIPSKAITMGVGNILSANKIILIACGKSKAQAVKDMIEGFVNPSCPASILKTHSNVEVYLDTNASSLLLTGDKALDA